jgi:hypothetical protein
MSATLENLPEMSGHAPLIPTGWSIYPIDGGWVFATDYGPIAQVNTREEAEQWWAAVEAAQSGSTEQLQSLLSQAGSQSNDDTEVSF